ncbi:hypothetical protein [Nocardia sp. NPDC020380]|uniref:hypothetical protein n=1 Tax=Nocardia sp. NPDC020380 TaxID=3364309 RepID=UPI0037AE873E
MDEKLIVVDEIPTFRAGLTTVLERGGFEVAEPEATTAWIHRHPVDAAVVTAHTTDMRPIRELAAGFPHLVVVSVLVSAGYSDFRSALRAGAHAAVRWDSPPDEIVAVVRSAIAGQTVLPTRVVQSLARSSLGAPDRGVLRTEEVRWLRALAHGTSVVRLAREEGYSQREIFRRLADVYARMGARNRHEAIALASQWGLLSDPSESAPDHRAAVLPLRVTK